MGYEDDGPAFPDAEATALHFSAERCRLHAELAPGLNRVKVHCDASSMHGLLMQNPRICINLSHP